MPSPPARKVKPTVWLKEVHTAQLSSLQVREQQLLDIIEDIRTYAKTRAEIEKRYAMDLSKLTSQLLAKREIFTDHVKEPSDQYRTVQAAWKSCLEESDKLAELRMRSSEILGQEVCDKCRVLKNSKTIALRKALDNLSTIQADLSQSVKEFAVEYKQYTDDESAAYEARSKASAAENRLSKMETGVFTSVSTLKKNSTKMATKMLQCSAKSTTSRNGYLLELSAVNAHTERIHSNDMPALFKALDDGVFEQLSSCILQIARSEIDLCNNVLTTHPRIVEDSNKVDPTYNLQTFLKAHAVLNDQLLFCYEPVQGDPVNTLSKEFDEDARLEKETRTWARKVARDNKNITELQDKLTTTINRLSSGLEQPGETDLAALKMHLRKSQIGKMKAEAKLALLKSVGMPVDDILAQASQVHDAMSDDISIDSFNSSGQRSADAYSVNTDIPGSPRVPDLARTQGQGQIQREPSQASNMSLLYKAVAIYTYQANQEDELNLNEGEIIDILDHGIGDGWLKACNSEGKIGMVPENYIEAHQEEHHQEHTTPTDLHQAAAGEPVMPPPSATHQAPANGIHGIGKCQAMFDYVADAEDEISFYAGDIITLISRDVNGIDDGYWKGYVNGQTGMFPSVVVEEIEGNSQTHLGIMSNQFFTDPAQQAEESPTGNQEEEEQLPPPPPELTEETQQQPETSTETTQGEKSLRNPAQPPAVDRSRKPQLYTSNRRPPPLISSVEQHLPPVAEVTETSILARHDEVQQQNQTITNLQAEYDSMQPELSTGQGHHQHNQHQQQKEELGTPKQQHLPPWERKDRKPPGASNIKDRLNYDRSDSEISDQSSQEPHKTSHRDLYSHSQSQDSLNQFKEPIHSHNAHYEGQRSEVYDPQYDYESVIPARELYPAVSTPPRDRSQSTPHIPNPAQTPPVERVEGRRFRQMQPVPHQYYLDHVSGESNSQLQRDRAQSARSLQSQSSTDSLDTLGPLEKQTPIRLPGRSDIPVESQLPVSLRDASHLLSRGSKGGLVNPSYRVAVEFKPSPQISTRGRPQSTSGYTPSPAKRVGGLPGHIRQSMKLGKQTLDDTTNASSTPPAATNNTSAAANSRMHRSKSETAV